MRTKPDLEVDGHDKKRKSDSAPPSKAELKKTLLAKSICLLLTDYKPANDKQKMPNA